MNEFLIKNYISRLTLNDIDSFARIHGIEFNDDELHIVFEGREEDFKEVEKSFVASGVMVENIGYENHWRLSFIKNFDAENLMDSLLSLADSLRDMCETKKELYDITGFMKQITPKNIMESHQKLQEILDEHLQKWNNSTDKYKKSKIDLLMLRKAEMNEIWNYISGMDERRDKG